MIESFILDERILNFINRNFQIPKCFFDMIRNLDVAVSIAIEKVINNYGNLLDMLDCFLPFLLAFIKLLLVIFISIMFNSIPATALI
ncbi:hypothetical protein BT96DRAFT_672487 [Gymnopus androsaceus JB14]|uniref:Uncharacterized protein n=1 Tax=Gymnopus androsaceus JB14 TaxID=1447944 RepID=A0A6A4HSN8_9AGAR|nr:hypothetical protein BT96DRAFT_672487 [Gymnopus androsaceus JB14]